jgi:RNA polymerase sigma-70 factor (ECF subfamily)
MTITVEEIVNTYGDMMYKLATAQISNKADAFDVVQDVFLKIHIKMPKTSSPEHLKAWLIRAVINRCRDYNRKNRNTEELRESGLPAKNPFFDDPEYDLQEAVANLPPKYRTVLYLHYYEGYKIAEISKMLGVGESGIKKRLVKAREKLKDYLTDD